MNNAEDETNPQDSWPASEYGVGQHRHVHAIGVISLLTAQFERSVDSFHAYHRREQNAPDDLIDLYYYSLNEEKRLEAIRTAFEQFEADPAVKDAINNLVRYFHWCRDARNKLLHAEPYPPSLGGDPQLLYLIKRIDKRSRQSGYMKLSVDYLRSIAVKSERVSYKVQEQASIFEPGVYRWKRLIDSYGPTPANHCRNH